MIALRTLLVVAATTLVAAPVFLAGWRGAPTAPGGTPAYLVPPRSPVVPDAMARKIEKLSGWIRRNSRYTDIPAPPILFLSQAELAYLSAFPNPSSRASQVLAVYVDGVILLSETFRLGRDDYVLLHELVHHAQARSRAKFTCMAEREAEAYDLQRRFVAETGRGAVPDEIFLLSLRCGF